MSAVRTLSPRKARTDNELCQMRRDNFDTDNHWILTDTFRVTIAAQKLGEGATQSITVPRKTFDKLVDWYMREQKLRAAK
jgi:hypothetical protein